MVSISFYNCKTEMYQKIFSCIEEFRFSTMLQTSRHCNLKNEKQKRTVAYCVEIGLQQMSVKLIKLHAYYSNSLLD